MAASGTVTTYINGDISGLKRATRDAAKEFQNVGRSAQRANTDAARGSTRALAGVFRLVETGKVSAKSLDKVGRSASGAISAASGFAGGIGAALGLGALPALSDLAIGAISRLRAANKSLATRINEAAAAQRNYNSASLAASGALDAITLADLAARDAHKALADAQKDGSKSTAEMTRLQLAAAAADRDAITARLASKAAIDAAKKAEVDYGKSLQTALDKLDIVRVKGASLADQLKVQAKFGREAAQVLLQLSGSNVNLSEKQKDADRSLAKYIQTANLTPKQIKTLISLSGHGKSVKQLLEFLGLTDKIPPKKNTQITTTGHEKAIREIQATRTELNSLHDKVVNVTVQRHEERTTSGPGGATGMRIGGTPNTRDDVHIRVSQGEVVLDPRQQMMVDSGMTVDQALSATGAPTIRAGGGFASGGKAKREERNQKLLDAAKDRFGATMSDDDLALAQAEQTPVFADDARILNTERGHILRRIHDIRRLRSRKGLTRQQKQDLNDEEASLIRQLGGIGQQLKDGAAVPDVGGDTATIEPDPFALERATIAGREQGLGLAAQFIFGGSGDIGSGGSNAIGAVGGKTMMVEKLVLAPTVSNHATLADGSNRGNATSNRTRTFSPRMRVAW